MQTVRTLLRVGVACEASSRAVLRVFAAHARSVGPPAALQCSVFYSTCTARRAFVGRWGAVSAIVYTVARHQDLLLDALVMNNRIFAIEILLEILDDSVEFCVCTCNADSCCFPAASSSMSSVCFIQSPDHANTSRDASVCPRQVARISSVLIYKAVQHGS